MTEKEYSNVKLFMNKLDSQINDFINKYIKTHSIVFVGIMDITINNKTFVYKFKCDNVKLIYLTLPVAQLLKQFYGRIGKMDCSYWNDIASKSNKRMVIQSSSFIIADIKKLNQCIINTTTKI